MNISQNVKQLLESKNQTQKALASHLGIATSTINNWIKLDRSIPAEYVIPICEFLEITPYYLLTGNESKLATVEFSADIKDLLKYYDTLQEMDKGIVLGTAKTLSEIEHQRKQITESRLKSNEDLDEIDEDEPLYLNLFDMPVSAGRGAYIDYTVGEPMCVPRNDETESADYLVRVSGDSMEPRFSNGDLVLVESTLMVDVGEIGIFILNNEAYIKKRGKDRLISLNDKYPDIPIGENDHIYCQGRVIGILDVEKGE